MITVCESVVGCVCRYMMADECGHGEWGGGGVGGGGGWVFFFKQKTAYEIRNCDWSSDVCSSDLYAVLHFFCFSLFFFSGFRAPPCRLGSCP